MEISLQGTLKADGFTVTSIQRRPPGADESLMESHNVPTPHEFTKCGAYECLEEFKRVGKKPLHLKRLLNLLTYSTIFVERKINPLENDFELPYHQHFEKRVADELRAFIRQDIASTNRLWVEIDQEEIEFVQGQEEIVEEEIALAMTFAARRHELSNGSRRVRVFKESKVAVLVLPENPAA